MTNIFGTQTEYGVGNNPTSITASDFNGDGNHHDFVTGSAYV